MTDENHANQGRKTGQRAYAGGCGEATRYHAGHCQQMGAIVGRVIWIGKRVKFVSVKQFTFTL